VDSYIVKENNMQRELIIQKLKEQGFRITKQREILLDIILEQDFSSCKELYYKANAIDSSIGVATVYRIVNILEEIGVFSRKNLFKISCSTECNKENVCMIKFEDNTCCQLSAKTWYSVIAEGLKACGYGNGKRICSVEAEPCTKNCC